jgi:hypothetical protein
MKKLFLILSLLLVVGGAGVVYLTTNMDAIAKRAIESAGTTALGTAVRVDSVSINLTDGSATLSGFTVANPQGFSNRDMIRFDELRVAIDIRSLNSEVIRINSISSVNPYVFFEMRGNRSNFDVIRERFPPQQTPADPDANEPVIAINEIVINGIQGAVQADQLPAPVSVNLGNVSIPPVQGTPVELAQQIGRPLLTQLARNAGAALTRVTAEAIEAELRERAGEVVDEAARNLRERLGL